MINSEELERLIANAQLPALPQSAIQLMELSRDESNGPAEFAIPIEADPGLTSQVLRFINSSFFGFSQEVNNVRHAITLVGVKSICNFALWNAVFSLSPNPKCGPFDLKMLWQDSLRRALFTRALARKLRLPDPEELFTGALLQDLAIPLLAAERSEDYSEMLAIRSGGRRLADLERERFGWTHGEAAGLLARRWRLPPSFAANVATHSDFDACPSPSSQLIALSALLPSEADASWTEHVEFQTAFDRVASHLSESIEELFERVDSEFEEVAPVLQLAAPRRSLVDHLRAARVVSVNA